MAFEAEKDKLIAHVKTIVSDGSLIEVILYSYDGGPTKVALERRSLPQEGKEQKHLKLGRLTLDEASQLSDALQNISIPPSA